MNILAIESSCDETAVAIVRDGREVLTDCISSQVELHKLYGGVVPEIASRKHIEAIYGLADQALEQAQLTRGDIDAVAVTYAPGLIGAVLVGVNFANLAALGPLSDRTVTVPCCKPVGTVRGKRASTCSGRAEVVTSQSWMGRPSSVSRTHPPTYHASKPALCSVSSTSSGRMMSLPFRLGSVCTCYTTKPGANASKNRKSENLEQKFTICTLNSRILSDKLNKTIKEGDEAHAETQTAVTPSPDRL